MRTDFHYDAIFLLALKAGMREDVAHVLAYASEYVDWADRKTIIKWQDGGQFQPQQSSHKKLSPYFTTDKVGLKVYAPFHFFPCGQGTTFTQKVICRLESQPLGSLLKEVVTLVGEPFGLHALGIVLHVLADAYVHQNFSGLNDPSNRAKQISVMTDVMMDEALSFSKWLPAFGHMQVLTCPNEPACQWTYTDHGGQTHRVVNLPRVMAAAERIYDFLGHEVKQAMPGWYEGQTVPFEAFKEDFQVMMDLNCALKDRLKLWQHLFELGLFGQVTYKPFDPHLWFEEAIEKTRVFPPRFKRKEGFEASNWKLFQDALTYHMFFCQHTLFPSFGVYI